MKTYQVFSRNNDINGNPYRLVVTFKQGVFDKAYEARSSSPNIIHKLYKNGYQKGFRTVHLAPAEYNSIKKYWVMKDKIIRDSN